MTALQVGELYCFRDGGSRLIRGFSLQVEAGDNMLIRASERQRKALFECLTGLRSPDKGQVLVCGQDLAELNGKELARFRCEHIGAAYSDNGFVPEFSVMENLCLPLIAMEKRESEARERILWLTQKVLPVELLYSLGAHMLEVCPSLAADKPRIETHHLGIGMNEKDPARLVFEGKAGKGIVVSLVDMGGRLRLIVQDIEAVKPIMPMPNLPVARVMWRALPDLTTGVECWIIAGGAHHTVLSYDVTAEQMRDWARMMDIEFVHIGADTTPEKLEEELLVKDLVWKLK